MSRKFRPCAASRSCVSCHCFLIKIINNSNSNHEPKLHLRRHRLECMSALFPPGKDVCELEWNRTRCHENQTGGGGIPRLAHRSLQPITDLHAGQDDEGGKKSEPVYQHCSPLIIKNSFGLLSSCILTDIKI